MDATARTRRQRGPQAIAGGSARLRDSDGMDATARSRRLEHLRSYAASKDADQYDGAWTDDVKQGQGAMAFANGDRYDGSWNGDVRCGEGRCTFANGDTYDGHWHDDMRAGKGPPAFHNGCMADMPDDTSCCPGADAAYDSSSRSYVNGGTCLAKSTKVKHEMNAEKLKRMHTCGPTATAKLDAMTCPSRFSMSFDGGLCAMHKKVRECEVASPPESCATDHAWLIYEAAATPECTATVACPVEAPAPDPPATD